jgi:hypothetical protein
MVAERVQGLRGRSTACEAVPEACEAGGSGWNTAAQPELSRATRAVDFLRAVSRPALDTTPAARLRGAGLGRAENSVLVGRFRRRRVFGLRVHFSVSADSFSVGPKPKVHAQPDPPQVTVHVPLEVI